MNDTKNSLASIALDLNRVAIGINRGSEMMAKRFFQEALVRKSEISANEIPTYITNIIGKIDQNTNLDKQFAEDALMYSTILENFVVKNL